MILSGAEVGDAATEVGGALTALDVVTLLVAALALVVSAISLMWQIVTWKNSGSLLDVYGTNVALPPGPMSSGFNYHAGVAIQADNKGRAPTTVNACGFLLPSGQTLMRFNSWMKKVDLPFVIEAGGSFDYFFDAEDLARALKDQKIEVKDLKPYVKTGHGQVKGALRREAVQALEHHLGRL